MSFLIWFSLRLCLCFSLSLSYFVLDHNETSECCTSIWWLYSQNTRDIANWMFKVWCACAYTLLTVPVIRSFVRRKKIDIFHSKNFYLDEVSKKWEEATLSRRKSCYATPRHAKSQSCSSWCWLLYTLHKTWCAVHWLRSLCLRCNSNQSRFCFVFLLLFFLHFLLHNI